MVDPASLKNLADECGGASANDAIRHQLVSEFKQFAANHGGSLGAFHALHKHADINPYWVLSCVASAAHADGLSDYSAEIASILRSLTAPPATASRKVDEFGPKVPLIEPDYLQMGKGPYHADAHGLQAQALAGAGYKAEALDICDDGIAFAKAHGLTQHLTNLKRLRSAIEQVGETKIADAVPLLAPVLDLEASIRNQLVVVVHPDGRGHLQYLGKTTPDLSPQQITLIRKMSARKSDRVDWMWYAKNIQGVAEPASSATDDQQRRSGRALATAMSELRKILKEFLSIQLLEGTEGIYDIPEPISHHVARGHPGHDSTTPLTLLDQRADRR